MTWGVLLTDSSGLGSGRSASVILRRTPGFCWFQSANAAWPVTVVLCSEVSEAGAGLAAGLAPKQEGASRIAGARQSGANLKGRMLENKANMGLLELKADGNLAEEST